MVQNELKNPKIEISKDAVYAGAGRKPCEGIIKIGTTGDYAPVSFLDEKTGELSGTDIMFAKNLAEYLGLEPVFVMTSWPSLLDDLEAGKFDIAISGITASPERKERALLSAGYKKNGKTIICRRENARRFAGLSDIDKPEVTVAENRGGTNEAFAAQQLHNCRLIICDENAKAHELILNGTADVMITDMIEAKYLAELYDEIGAPLIGEPFTDDECCVLIGKHCSGMKERIGSFISKQHAAFKE